MPQAPGKKVALSQNLTEKDLDKIFAQKAKKQPKVTRKASTARKLGPGVTVPEVFVLAQQQLVEKLITRNVRKRQKNKVPGLDNILGMHIGQKTVEDEPTGSLAVVVTVRKKIKDPKKVETSCRIPKRVRVKTENGFVTVPVDVKIGSEVQPQAIGGQGCQGRERGAIACFVFFLVDNGANHTDFLLTNSHVVGRIATGTGSNISNDDVFDLTGTKIGGYPVRRGTIDDADGLSIDAAIASSSGFNSDAESRQHVSFTFSGNVETAQENDIVLMHGPQTGAPTRGRVRRVLPFKSVDYTAFGIGRHLFLKNVFEIQPVNSQNQPINAPFSAGGDSGSLIIKESNQAAVGILIGGGSDGEGLFSLAQDMATIQDDLGFFAIHGVP